jgi:ACS family tartrate transporter-like MFS transporter
MPVASSSGKATLHASDGALAAHTRHLIALRLLPFLFILYVTNYLDRTNVAYAALEMSKDLGFSDRVFGMGAGIFFVSYVALQLPGVMLVDRWGARRCISAILIAWGSLTALTGLVHTASEFYTARIILGGAEAAFFPGVVVYLSHWFIREDRAKAGSNFMAAIPLSFVIGSPLAGWILGQHWLNLAGWRWLFVLEGLPAVLLGVVAFFYLTDCPADADWLEPRQREWIVNKLDEETPVETETLSVWQVIGSRPVLILATAAFLEYFVAYTFMFWFPTLLKRMSGLSNSRIGLLGTLPYIVGFIALQINGWHSDKTGERRWHAAIPVFIAATALLGLITLPTTTRLTVVLFTVMYITQGFLAVFWTIPTEILGASQAAAAVGMINAVASVAGFAGPYLFGYLQTRTGSFTYGLGTMMAAAVLGGMMVLMVPKSPPLPED